MTIPLASILHVKGYVDIYDVRWDFQNKGPVVKFVPNIIYNVQLDFQNKACCQKVDIV